MAGTKRNIYDARLEKASINSSTAQTSKRVNYFLVSLQKVQHFSTPIMHYWQQTPSAVRIVGVMAALPMLFIPIISFIICLPAIVFSIAAGYSGIFGKEALIADAKEAFAFVVPQERAEKLYSNITSERTKQMAFNVKDKAIHLALLAYYKFVTILCLLYASALSNVQKTKQEQELKMKSDLTVFDEVVEPEKATSMSKLFDSEQQQQQQEQ